MSPWITATSVPELLGPWVTEQRWYAAKGRPMLSLDRVGGVRLTVPGEDDVVVEVHFIAVRTAPDGTVLYQVPLTYRSEPSAALSHALIGRFTRPEGDRWIYDAPHDPAFVRALAALLAGGTAGTGGDPTPGAAIGVPQRTGPVPSDRSRVLRGEQSNTSIIIDPDGPDPVIVKLFRVLQPGTNPDVVVQTRLAAAGCDRVPAPVGWVEGTWTSPVPEVGTVTGHLAYACEFVADGEDAWQVACGAVERGESFTAQARALGAATAQVHTALANALPRRALDADAVRHLADGLAARVDWAVGVVPALETFAAPARAAVAAVGGLAPTAGTSPGRDGSDGATADLPDLQQVHGDFHLGQVLHSPTRGWIVLDFEGEPLRPLGERLEPDLALRDVAGMLRSFDYAAGHATLGSDLGDPSTAAATAWTEQARHAFLDGYTEAGGRIEPGGAGEILLRALEIDKAMYEVVYETLNRPSWVRIPLRALERLTAPHA